MVARCSSAPSADRFGLYAARGIKVCVRWQGPTGFANFLADIGPRPSPQHSIERKNNDGDYKPGNVKWATRAEQARNTRRTIKVKINGRTQCLKDWADETGVLPWTLYARYRNGVRGAALLVPRLPQKSPDNRGWRNGQAKLSVDDVRAIRRRAPKERYADLATEFNVFKGTISDIVRRVRWKHI